MSDQPNAPQQPQQPQQPSQQQPQPSQAQPPQAPPVQPTQPTQPPQQAQPPQQPQAPQQPGYPQQAPQQPYAPQAPQQPQQPGYAPQAPQQPVQQPYPPQQQPYPQQPQPGYAPQQPGYPPQPQPAQYGQPQQPGYPAQAGYPGQQGYPGAQPVAVSERKGLSKGALIGIIGGGIAALAVIAIVITTIFSGGGGGGILGPKSPEDKAVAAVESFMNALVKGDSKEVYKHVWTEQTNKLTSDAALKKSQELAPITNIVVDKEGIAALPDSFDEKKPDFEVGVSFDMGGEHVTRTFKVTSAVDEYRIQDSMASLSLGSFKGLKPTVNGIEPGEDYLRVFPGAYQVELGVKEFKLDTADNVFLIVDDSSERELSSAKAVLTDDAVKKFRDMVRASLTECLAMKTLSTPCGMDLSKGFSSGEQAVDGTVTRTLTTEGDSALNNLTARASGSTPTVMRAQESIRVTIETDAVRNGQTVRLSVLFGAPLKTPTVDFGAATPTVTWQ